jgi:hypothetical protein
MNCRSFKDELPDLVLTPGALPSASAVAHMRECPPCADEYVAFQAMFGALDAWRTPQPTPYFDQKLAVRIREEQAAPRMSWFERLETRLRLNTGRHFRPALAGALALARNEQAFQQMDELQQDEDNGPQNSNAAAPAMPTS